MFRRISEGLRRFMFGRYGTDKLNFGILLGALVLTLASSILSRCGAVCRIISIALTAATYGLLFLALFRMLSRNLSARQRELQRFTGIFSRIRDRANRYYRCPNCKQLVRVPKGRGKICIKCPKCSEKFIRKS